MAKAKEKPGVMVYWETFDVLESLVDGDAKQMLAAIRQYSQYGVLPDFTGNAILTTLWLLIRPKLDADSERYERISNARAEAGRRGGLARANNAKQNQANEANATFAKQIKPTTTTSTTATATTSTTTYSEAPAEPEKGKRGNEERDKGVTCHTAPVPIDNPNDDFERRKQEQIAALRAYLGGDN